MLIIHRKISIKNPIFLYCVGGGMGNVAKLVGKKIIKRYKPKKFASIFSYSYPNTVLANNKGILKNFELSLYHFKKEEQDFIILYGDLQPLVQPFDIKDQYMFSYNILKLLKKLKTKEIVSIGGYGLEIEPEDPKIYFAANNKKTLEKLKKILEEDFNLYRNSNIVGMSGLIVSLARYFKIPGYIMLAETYPTANLNGFLGARKVLEILSKLYGFDYDLKDYEEKGMKLRENVAKQIFKEEKKEKKEKKRDIYYFG